jgi:hypothetical protein
MNAYAALATARFIDSRFAILPTGSGDAMNSVSGSYIEDVGGLAGGYHE